MFEDEIPDVPEPLVLPLIEAPPEADPADVFAELDDELLPDDVLPDEAELPDDDELVPDEAELPDDDELVPDEAELPDEPLPVLPVGFHERLSDEDVPD